MLTTEEITALLALRHDLHQHPELSWKEERTATKLVEALERIGARDVRRVAGTGVVARIAGAEPSGGRAAPRSGDQRRAPRVAVPSGGGDEQHAPRVAVPSGGGDEQHAPRVAVPSGGGDEQHAPRVAVPSGGGDERHAPRVAVRGDIDALPIQEATGLDWASSVPGVMHACGHDVHATWTIGAAILLARTPAAGDVIIVLQPAEEVGAGASAVLASGALDGVQAIFGAHVDRRFAVGQVVAEAGPLAASADTFEIELVGRGAHGARPHEGADSIVGAAALVTALQTIVSRRIDPSAAAVVTVGSVHAGVASNVIPDRARLTGTLRAMQPAVRQALHDGVRSLATTIASAYGLEARIALEMGTPPIVNPAREAAWARTAAERVVGANGVVPFGITNMAGEDFAFYMERMPGCFLRIGAREPGGERTPAHNPKFVAADDCIAVGAAVLAECAREACARLSQG